MLSDRCCGIVQGTANIADDIIVHGKTTAEHDERLEKVFQTLLKAGLTLNKEKCQFGMTQLEFMGHLISHWGVGPTKSRLEAIREAKEPRSAAEVRSFLGLVNFCSRFIPNMASISEPLRRLTTQNGKFEWKDEQKEAFQKLKNAPPPMSLTLPAIRSVICHVEPVPSKNKQPARVVQWIQCDTCPQWYHTMCWKCAAWRQHSPVRCVKSDT